MSQQCSPVPTTRAFIEYIRSVHNVGDDFQFEKRCSECLNANWRLLTPCGHFVCIHQTVCLCMTKVVDGQFFAEIPIHKKYLRVKRHFKLRKSKTPLNSPEIDKQISEMPSTRSATREKAVKQRKMLLVLKKLEYRPGAGLSDDDEEPPSDDKDEDYTPGHRVYVSHSQRSRSMRSRSKTSHPKRRRSCGDKPFDEDTVLYRRGSGALRNEALTENRDFSAKSLNTIQRDETCQSEKGQSLDDVTLSNANQDRHVRKERDRSVPDVIENSGEDGITKDPLGTPNNTENDAAPYERIKVQIKEEDFRSWDSYLTQIKMSKFVADKSSSHGLVMGEKAANWGNLITYTSNLLQTLFHTRPNSQLTLADWALRAMNPQFSRVSPLSDCSSSRVNDFLDASTVKTSAGVYSTGGEARKRLFEDENRPNEDDFDSNTYPQNEIDALSESEEIVFGTPTEKMPAPLLSSSFIMTSTKVIINEDEENDTPGWRPSTIEPEQDPLSITHKRATVVESENPPKRQKLDQTRDWTLSDASIIENTEQSVIKSRVALPLGATNLLLDSFRMVESPKKTATPLKNVQNLPELEIRCSSIRDKGCLSKILKFMELARRTHSVRSFDMKISRTTTHLIIDTVETTPKFLKAIYQGTAVMTYKWVLDSLDKGTVLPEGPYVIREAGRPLDIFAGTIFTFGNLDKDTHEIVKDLLDYCSCSIVSSVQDCLAKMKSGQYSRGVVIHNGGRDFSHLGCEIYCASPMWVYLSISERQAKFCRV